MSFLSILLFISAFYFVNGRPDIIGVGKKVADNAPRGTLSDDSITKVTATAVKAPDYLSQENLLNDSITPIEVVNKTVDSPSDSITTIGVDNKRVDYPFRDTLSDDSIPAIGVDKEAIPFRETLPDDYLSPFSVDYEVNEDDSSDTEGDYNEDRENQNPFISFVRDISEAINDFIMPILYSLSGNKQSGSFKNVIQMIRHGQDYFYSHTNPGISPDRDIITELDEPGTFNSDYSGLRLPYPGPTANAEFQPEDN